MLYVHGSGASGEFSVEVFGCVRSIVNFFVVLSLRPGTVCCVFLQFRAESRAKQVAWVSALQRHARQATEDSYISVAEHMVCDEVGGTALAPTTATADCFAVLAVGRLCTNSATPACFCWGKKMISLCRSI